MKILLRIAPLTCKLSSLVGNHHASLLRTECHETFLRHSMAADPVIAIAIGLSILILLFRHNPILESVIINGFNHTFVTYYLVIGWILTP